MLRHVPQPLHARGLEADIGVEAAGDGAVDDGLLLLLQQLDQLLLGADVAPDPPVRVVEEADDGGLFGRGAASIRNHLKVLSRRSTSRRYTEVQRSASFAKPEFATNSAYTAEEMRRSRALNHICWAHDALICPTPDSTLHPIILRPGRPVAKSW